MKKGRILVTGAAGYIGSHTTVEVSTQLLFCQDKNKV